MMLDKLDTRYSDDSLCVTLNNDDTSHTGAAVFAVHLHLCANHRPSYNGMPTCGCRYRISVYAATPTDWKKTASWVVKHGLADYGNNRWMVQLPRIYRVFKKIGKVACFQDTLNNFFAPLFEATLHPEAEEHKDVATFMANVSGFDSVDDESIADVALDDSKTPGMWTRKHNPYVGHTAFVTLLCGTALWNN